MVTHAEIIPVPDSGGNVHDLKKKQLITKFLSNVNIGIKVHIFNDSGPVNLISIKRHVI